MQKKRLKMFLLWANNGAEIDYQISPYHHHRQQQQAVIIPPNWIFKSIKWIFQCIWKWTGNNEEIRSDINKHGQSKAHNFCIQMRNKDQEGKKKKSRENHDVNEDDDERRNNEMKVKIFSFKNRNEYQKWLQINKHEHV